MLCLTIVTFSDSTNFMRKILFTFILSYALALAHGQSTVDQVLAAIEENNKTLAAKAGFLEKKRLEYHTGLTPNDPTAEFDYLFGTPADLGNQTEFMVVQSFDFPSAYAKKGRIADEKSEQLEIELAIARQEVLLEASTYCMELIYLNKLLGHIEGRVASARRVKEVMEVRLQHEEITTIEANKARVALLNYTTKSQLLQSEREQWHARLQGLNGGEPISFQDMEYPFMVEVPEVATLIQAVEEQDLKLRKYEKQRSVSEMQVGLARAMALPRFEAGYRYQAILGQKFNGIHMGISLPLWESRNTVKVAQANIQYTQMEQEQHQTTQEHFIREQYEKYEALRKNLTAYQDALEGLNNEALLEKLLEQGEISFIEYALDMDYYFKAWERYLELERELYITLARMMKHEL